MSEQEKSERGFWQIHLSTAVLLMLVAGGLLYPVSSVFREAFNQSANLSNSPDWYTPIDFIIVAVFALGTLLGAGILCEFLVRRHEDRQP